jgi:hypothetical protein
MGMDIDMPKVGQSQQTQDTGNPSLFESPEEAPRVNGVSVVIFSVRVIPI